MNSFYTYAYLREDGTPYYVGKGTGDRWKLKHRQGFIKVPSADRVLFLKEDLTEAQAFAHERYMIAVLGRKDLGTGCLRNLTDGGEGTSGRLYSEETKAKLRAAHKNGNRVYNDRKLSEETKAKLSAATKKQLAEKGHPRAKPVEIDGVVYPHAVAAAKALGVSKSTIYRRFA